MRRTTTTTTTMPPLREINGETKIIFTLYTFLGFMGAILGIFFGFYTVVIAPKFNDIQTRYNISAQDQKAQNQLFYQELGKINTSIGSLESTINSISRNNERQFQNKSNISDSKGWINYDQYLYPNKKDSMPTTTYIIK